MKNQGKTPLKVILNMNMMVSFRLVVIFSARSSGRSSDVTTVRRTQKI